MVTERTQALLTALRDQVEDIAERYPTQHHVATMDQLKDAAYGATLLTDIMDRLLAANAMARRPAVSGEQEAMDYDFCDSLN